MKLQFLTALVACVTGAVCMYLINKFVGREHEKRILDRRRYFKYCHNNFWAKSMNDGSIEFWAYSCKTEESWYLGKFENGKIIECTGFYGHTLPWSVQKGAERLFSQFTKLIDKCS